MSDLSEAQRPVLFEANEWMKPELWHTRTAIPVDLDEHLSRSRCGNVDLLDWSLCILPTAHLDGGFLLSGNVDGSHDKDKNQLLRFVGRIGKGCIVNQSRGHRSTVCLVLAWGQLPQHIYIAWLSAREKGKLNSLY